MRRKAPTFRQAQSSHLTAIELQREALVGKAVVSEKPADEVQKEERLADAGHTSEQRR